MKKVSRMLFEIWPEQQNTHHRVQPVVGTKLETQHIIFRVNNTPKKTFWQRVRGWL
ncbi:hypothetical protein [Lactobacillus sp. CBA3605]|uniref:hypothetical protein n=1 Tax=Lactobacillus sp. CBA3605 TaxID=2099788 RepID=UPI001319E770|nr:hypothetical protein [Lactobacillus sp. CBA3605]